MRFEMTLSLMSSLILLCSGSLRAEDAVEIRVTELPNELMVPHKFWDDLNLKDDKNRVIFAPIRTFFKEKNSGALKRPRVNFSFARGGGSIDLSKVTAEKTPGSFFVNFSFFADTKFEVKELYFFSHSKKRKLVDEMVGAGCDKWMKMSPAFVEKMEENGLLLNTTKSFHDSVAGGSFVFVGKKANEIWVSQVTFYDSTHPELFCEDESKHD